MSKEKRTMIFNCAGLDSEEEYEVISRVGTIVTLDTDEEVEKCHQFDGETGKCLNDDTTFGCSRRLKM